MDKSRWGDGPWQNEPDELDWIDERTGLRCHILRHPEMGQLNGYVGVPASHVLYGWQYDDHIRLRPDFLEGASDQVGIIDMFCYALGGGDKHGTIPVGLALKAHQGVNFSGNADFDDSLWWFGFDCSHAWDYAPGFVADLRRTTPAVDDFYKPEKYRTIEYVTKECEGLAFQLRQLEAERGLTNAIELIKASEDNGHG
jgi:hypothetical protein